MNKKKTGITDTKILSARLSVEEVARLDEMAEKAGVTRSDFIRMSINSKVRESQSLPLGIEEIHSLCRTIRETTCKLDRCRGLLGDILLLARERSAAPDNISFLDEQIRQCEHLEDLYFQLEMEAVGLMDAIREDDPFPTLLNR